MKIAVAENYKGNRLGKDMIEKRINSAIKMNLQIIAWAFNKSRLIARRLYENYGLINVGSLNDKSVKFILNLHDE